MEGLNFLDLTVKYFNVIVFILCVLFGVTALFASWIAWREIQRKRNIIRSVIAAYNIAEEALENGRTGRGDFQIDPAMAQTVLNTLLEILNAVYGEVTAKPMPAADERAHGAKKRALLARVNSALFRKDPKNKVTIDNAVPKLLTTEKENHQSMRP